MKHFARFMLAWLAFDLVRANSAPVRNTLNIEWIEKKISEWDLILLRCERNLT